MSNESHQQTNGVTAYCNLRILAVEQGEYAEADTLVVDGGGRIQAIGERGDVTARFPGATTRDLAGLTVMPGLIDAHVHLVLDPTIHDPAKQDALSPEAQFAAMAERAKAMVAAGITTARDLGGGRWQELRLRDEIADGVLPGPRLLCAGQPITTPAGHCHFWGGEAADGDSALAVLDRQLAAGVDLIKVMATGGSMTPGSRPVDAQFDGATLGRITSAAAAAGRHVAAHCHGTAGIANAAAAGVATIEHCSWVGEKGWWTAFDEDVVAQMCAHDVWVSTTINAGWARFRSRPEYAARIKDCLARMQQAGVRLIASTDAGIPNVHHHHLALALPVFAELTGCDNAATLRAATVDCASAIGLGHITGRLAPGYAADLLFVEGDPLRTLETLAQPAWVLARGIPMTSLA